MKKELVAQLHHAFENIVRQDEKNKKNKKNEKIEFWYARDLQKILGYNEWRNFLLLW